MHPVHEARKQKGLEIAATAKIVKKGNSWSIPSQSGKGRYTVRLQARDLFCTCADFETNGCKCQHIYAVEFVRQRGAKHAIKSNADRPSTHGLGRKTYSEDWRAYNAAQTSEKEKFLELLRDLCSGVTEQISTQRAGRPRLPIQDAVFSACFKVYSTVSCRRFMADLKEAHAKGHITKVPHFNSIFNYLENSTLTPILRQMIIETSLPSKL